MNRVGKSLFRKSYVAGIFLGLFFLFFGRVQGAGPYSVFILNSYHSSYFWTDDMVRGIVTTFKEKHINAKVSIEYLDTRRYSLDTVFPDLLRLYQAKYGTMHFDIIITTDNNALEFLRRCRSKLFFGIPIVFCGLDLTDNSVLDGFDQITGVVEDMGEEYAVDAALKLHPLAGRLVVVNNKASNPIKNVKSFCDSYRKRKEVLLIEITEFTAEQFLEKIGTFGLESIVLLPTRFVDSNGTDYTDEPVRNVILQSCKAPIYINNILLAGLGPVGGCMNIAEHHGRIAGEMAVRILNGENVKNIPIIHKGPRDFLFDYNQLKRFGISISKLPPHSNVINEPKSFYYQHRKQVWLVTAVFVVLSMMVLVLLANVIRRKRMEKKLLEYHAQLKSLASELSLAEERERRRIAMELHDNISQSLVISKVMLEQLRESEASEHIAGVLDNVCDMLGKTVENSRLLTFDLGSPILYELGFETAVADCLTEQVQKHNIATEFEDDGQPKPLDDDVRGILFRMVRELLINVVKHAHADRVKVSVRRMNNRIYVSVEDNGVGFNPEKIVFAGARTGGFGLFSIRERLEQLDGQLKIKSAPDSGCRVTIIAPLKT